MNILRRIAIDHNQICGFSRSDGSDALLIGEGSVLHCPATRIDDAGCCRAGAGDTYVATLAVSKAVAPHAPNILHMRRASLQAARVVAGAPLACFSVLDAAAH